MDSESINQPDSPKPKRLRTLACSVVYPGENNLIHKFVLDNSSPNDSGSESDINAVLLSMYDVPASVGNAFNLRGFTPLHLAVRKNNLLMVTKLLSCLVNIDVNAKCRRASGNTALHIAAKLAHLSIIQELLNKGACLEMLNRKGKTALCLAAKSADLDKIKLLVRRGANVNKSVMSTNPLCYAARSDNLAVVEFLVGNGADLNTRNGVSALYCAALSGSLKTLEFLVSVCSADVNSRDTRLDQTPIHAAAYSGKLEVVKFLVANRADMNSADVFDRTPLHSAISGRSSDVAKFLVDQGADLGAVDVFGRTLLHYAVKHGDLESVKLLVTKGAYLCAVDDTDETPIHYLTMDEESIEIVTFLKEQGADLDAVDNNWENSATSGTVRKTSKYCGICNGIADSGALHQDRARYCAYWGAFSHRGADSRALRRRGVDSISVDG